MAIHLHGIPRKRFTAQRYLCGEDPFKQYHSISMFGNYDLLLPDLCQDCLDLLPIFLLSDEMDPSEDCLSIYDLDPLGVHES